MDITKFLDILAKNPIALAAIIISIMAIFRDQIGKLLLPGLFKKILGEKDQQADPSKKKEQSFEDEVFHMVFKRVVYCFPKQYYVTSSESFEKGLVERFKRHKAIGESVTFHIVDLEYPTKQFCIGLERAYQKILDENGVKCTIIFPSVCSEELRKTRDECYDMISSRTDDAFEIRVDQWGDKSRNMTEINNKIKGD